MDENENDDNGLAIQEATEAGLSRPDERIDGLSVTTTRFNETNVTHDIQPGTVDSNGNKDKNMKIEMCRICLADDRELSPILPENREAFNYVLPSEDENKQPGSDQSQSVCRECHARMTSFTRFRKRAIQTNTLLNSLISPFIYVSQDPRDGTRRPEPSGFLGYRPCLVHPGRFSVSSYSVAADPNIPGGPHRVLFCMPQRQGSEPRQMQ